MRTLAVVRTAEVHPDHLRILHSTRENAERCRDAFLGMAPDRDPIEWFELVANHWSSDGMPWSVVMSYSEDAS